MKAIFFCPDGKFIHAKHFAKKDAKQIFTSKKFQGLPKGEDVGANSYLVTVCYTDREAEELYDDLNGLLYRHRHGSDWISGCLRNPDLRENRRRAGRKVKALLFDQQERFLFGKDFVPKTAVQIYNSKEFQAWLNGEPVETSDCLVAALPTEKEAIELERQLRGLMRSRATSKKAGE